MKRRKMSKTENRRTFSKGNRVQHKNVTGLPLRGGIRL